MKSNIDRLFVGVIDSGILQNVRLLYFREHRKIRHPSISRVYDYTARHLHKRVAEHNRSSSWPLQKRAEDWDQVRKTNSIRN